MSVEEITKCDSCQQIIDEDKDYSKVSRLVVLDSLRIKVALLCELASLNTMHPMNLCTSCWQKVMRIFLKETIIWEPIKKP